MATVVQENLRESLEKYFGFDTFKNEQEIIIENLLEGNDSFVVMPTGGGKSLCFQLPAMIMEGTAIVVSPLIALMKNQVDLVRSYSKLDNIAHFLNSSLTKAQIKNVKEDILNKKTKLLYVAPETLNKQENLDFFKEITISFLAVDEAHCISEWGHDFRPEYRKIRDMIDSLGGEIPLMALTATATPKVQTDIIKNLQLRDPKIYVSSFNRPNLFYEVRPKGKNEVVIKSIVKSIKSFEGKSGIIYCLSRKSTEELAEILRVNDINAIAYHAGLDSSTRAKRQDDFMMDDVQVIVATIAFGLGIDKPDIRFVIHYNIPRSLEAYYQETGRAGRDGLEGKCIAYYNYKDILKLEKFLRDKPVSEREIGTQLLLETSAFAEISMCRRKYLLHYFGENYPKEECGNCDNCLNPKERFETKDQMVQALSIIESLTGHFELTHIVDILIGNQTQRTISYSHDQLGSFGIGSDEDDFFWNAVLRKALIDGLLFKEIENYGLLKITDKGRKYLKSPYSIKLSKNHDFQAATDADDTVVETSALDTTLLKILKTTRKEIAKKHNLPPYVIFQDPSIDDMATQYPTTLDELSNITGVSKGKAIRYGKLFVELIDKYVEENNIERPNDLIIKSIANKSRLKVYIIQNIDKKIPLADIAQSHKLSMDDLLTEIDRIVNSGTKVDIDYHIREVLDHEPQDIIYEYFREAESDSLQEAATSLKQHGFDLPEIQMMRIKFMSDLAN